jgi:hypothetical protein
MIGSNNTTSSRSSEAPARFSSLLSAPIFFMGSYAVEGPHQGEKVSREMPLPYERRW